MCKSPFRIKLPSGAFELVACRHCSVCRENRVNDLVGRALAEGLDAETALAVTLTYAGDGPETVTLNVPDVQKLVRRIRDAGIGVRYLIAGEYGEKKGRAHWHGALFFDRQFDPPVIGKRVDWKFWPHGFSFFQKPDFKGYRYLLKYALKSQHVSSEGKALEDGRLVMSKKPPLGQRYLFHYAARIAHAALPLHSGEYSVPGVVDAKGAPRTFWITSEVVRRNYIGHYLECFRTAHGREAPMTDYVLERYLDPIAREEREAERIEALKPREAPLGRPLGTIVLDKASGLCASAFEGGAGEVYAEQGTWRVSDYSAKGEKLAKLLESKGLSKPQSLALALWFQSKWKDGGPR